MKNMEALYETVNQLTPDELKQLYNYVTSQLTKQDEGEQSSQPRIAGLHAHLGEVWMSDDFNDPLVFSTESGDL